MSKQTEALKLAREAGIRDCTCSGAFGCLERFSELVAAHEREACAKVCESEGERIDASWMSCAAAIRARGQA